ncbi:MAG: hypothetical protein JW993_14715 [Sedimentisphaerales bacterium]|nr:hypothetical protein [Sedimentisphaerales bacterium]
MPIESTYRRAIRRTRRRARGGTIINILTAVIFFVAIAFGILWVIKQFGQAGQQYSQAMIDTSNKASVIKCQTNLRSIYQSLQVYAIENESFPSSQEELVRYCGDSRLFRCSEPNAPTYVYIPAQRSDASPLSVLLYEPAPVHEGKCSVLFAGGQIALLAPEELKQAIDATLANR